MILVSICFGQIWGFWNSSPKHKNDFIIDVYSSLSFQAMKNIGTQTTLNSKDFHYIDAKPPETFLKISSFFDPQKKESHTDLSYVDLCTDFSCPLDVRSSHWTQIACCFRAVGCIFGELLNNSPLFPGENDIEQLCCVLRVLGTPNQKVWPVSFFYTSVHL